MKTLSNLSKASVISYLLSNNTTVTTNADPWRIECDSDRDDILHYIKENEPVEIEEEELDTALAKLDAQVEDDDTEYAVVKCGELLILIDASEWSYTEIRSWDMPTPDTIVAFHITGGGGNRRHVKFDGEGNIYDIALSFNCVPTDADDPKAHWEDSAGNELSLTNEEAESGIGVLELDGDYDTWYTKRLKDVYRDEEYDAIDDEKECMACLLLYCDASFSDF